MPISFKKDQYLSVLRCNAVQILVNALRQGQARQRKIREPVRGDARIQDSVAGGYQACVRVANVHCAETWPAAIDLEKPLDQLSVTGRRAVRCHRRCSG